MASCDANQHTYRVRGISREWDKETLRSFLADPHRVDPSTQTDEQDHKAPTEHFRPKVFSLALEPDEESQTATVIFLDGKVPPSPIVDDDDDFHIEIDKDFHGITPLYSPPKHDHKIDIIAIPGLGGHAFGTFRQTRGGHMWLRDSLPKDLKGEFDEKTLRSIARVLTYGYDSNLLDHENFQSMEDIASSFRTALEDCNLSKPIVFISHSLGGIIVKEVLIEWSASQNQKRLLQAVRGVLFFGVPHNGMAIESLIPLVGELNRGLLETLSRNNSPILERQRKLFLAALREGNPTEIFSYRETRRSPTARKISENPDKWDRGGPPAVLVDQSSATVQRPEADGPTHTDAISLSHTEMVKFGPLDQYYKNVRGALRGICERAIQRSEIQEVPMTEVSEAQLKRREQVMKSLKYPHIDARLATVEHPHAETNRWILNHPTLRHWQEHSYIQEGHRMLWIKGNPGAGKSTLMKFTYNHMRKSAGETTFVSSFFFNARGTDELEKTVLGMYRSLLWNLLMQFPDLQVVFDDVMLLGRHRDTCSLVELKDLLQGAVLLLGDRSLIWFIDALDECKQDEVADMVRYFERIAASALKKDISLAICFSSRHYPTIRIQKSVEFVLDRNVDHERDLTSYITDRLQVDDHTIVEKVLKKASGVFLWAVLVVKILNKEDLSGGFAMKKRIDEVPGNLRELFKELLGQSGDAIDDATTKLSMQWLLFSRETLNPIQYRHAIWGGLLSQKLLEDKEFPDETGQNTRGRAEKYVVASSKGLAQVTPRGVLQLIHESIRDYLLKEGGLAEIWPELAQGPAPNLTHNIVGLSHATLQQSCMEFWNYWIRPMPQMPLYKDCLSYAVRRVFDHAEAAAEVCSQAEFLSNFPLSAYISQGRKLRLEPAARHQYGRDADLLYVLSFEGHVKLITTFLQLEDVGRRAAERAGRHRFPALAAAANGHQEALDVLLSSQAGIYVGADLFDGLQPVASGPEYIYVFHTPLSWAASRGHTGMVTKLLVSYDQPIDELANEQSPLSEAASNGHEGVVRLLIEHGADIDAGYPLAEVSGSGQERIIRLLIDHGANLNAGYPLVEALRYGKEEVFRLLIDHGADINAGYPLAEASSHGKEQIVRLLIEHGADLNAGYPLAKASRSGQERIIRLLIDHGADLNAGYPLVEVLRYGQERIIPLLIDHGVDINAGYPLAEASSHGEEQIVRLLIEHGADLEAGNPLIEASGFGKEQVARLLIEKGANISQVDDLGLTAIAKASRKGHTHVVEFLLRQHGAAVSAADRFGNTPIDMAVRNRHYEVTDSLLRHGATLHSTSNLANVSLLGWARLGCDEDSENGILQLLKLHTSNFDGSVRDDQAPVGYSSVPFEARAAWCDSCTITLQSKRVYYVCERCAKKRLTICDICWNRGTRCLDNSHEMFKRRY